jgi:hypothetical protein
MAGKTRPTSGTKIDGIDEIIILKRSNKFLD